MKTKDELHNDYLNMISTYLDMCHFAGDRNMIKYYKNVLDELVRDSRRKPEHRRYPSDTRRRKIVEYKTRLANEIKYVMQIPRFTEQDK